MFKKMLTFRHLVLMAFLFGTCLASNPLPAAPAVAAAPLACNLPAPSNLQAVIVSTNSISVDWDDVPGAVGYRTRVANAVTGQVYYDAVSSTSFSVVTGLPSATTVDVSVWAICANGDLGDVAKIQVTTKYIIIDDIAAGGDGFKGGGVEVICSTRITEPLCLAVVERANPANFEEFAIDRWGTIDVAVFHENEDPIGGIYEGAWYFGSENGVPIQGGWFFATIVYVYKPAERSSNLGWPVMAFEVYNTPYLTICYPDQIHFNGQTIPNDKYRVWMGCGEGSKNRSSSSPNLQTSPNPFQNVLNVVLDDANASEVALMDASGRIVRSQSVAEGTQTLSFETADLAPGLYLLRCQGPNAVKTTKVIKSR